MKFSSENTRIVVDTFRRTDSAVCFKTNEIGEAHFVLVIFILYLWAALFNTLLYDYWGKKKKNNNMYDIFSFSITIKKKKSVFGFGFQHVERYALRLNG